MPLEHVIVPAGSRRARHRRILRDARRLVARRYLERGTIGEDAIAPDGTHADHFSPRADTMITIDTEMRPTLVVATARLIRGARGRTLPVVAGCELYLDAARWLKRYQHTRIAEVSALAVIAPSEADARRGGSYPYRLLSLGLYANLWHHAWSGSTEDAWVAAIDLRVLATMERFFPFRRLGGPTPYLGSACVPVGLDLLETYLHVRRGADPDLFRRLLQSIGVSAPRI